MARNQYPKHGRHPMSDIAQDMPWLAKAWHAVQHRLAEDRLPHALLVAGERGVGKRAWAEAVAGLLLCDRREDLGNGSLVACGHCKQCELLRACSHPELRIYAPEISRMVNVDQVTALSTFAVGSRLAAPHKVP